MSAAEDHSEAPEAFASWAILELMGHRRLAGYVQAVEMGGGAFMRIDVPAADGGNKATQFYRPAAIYCITPTTEETARRVAAMAEPAPVQAWELPQLEKPSDDDEDEMGF